MMTRCTRASKDRQVRTLWIRSDHPRGRPKTDDADPIHLPPLPPLGGKRRDEEPAHGVQKESTPVHYSIT